MRTSRKKPRKPVQDKGLRRSAAGHRRRGTKPAPAPGLVTRASAAAALGVAPNRINKWVSDGAPVAERGSRGHAAYYDLDALKAWRQDRARKGGGESATQGEAGLSLAEERARLAKAQRLKIELDRRVRLGQLIEVADAVEQGQAVLAGLKARLLALPRQAVMRGIVPREVEPALHALVVEALRELARWHDVDDATSETADEDVDDSDVQEVGGELPCPA